MKCSITIKNIFKPLNFIYETKIFFINPCYDNGGVSATAQGGQTLTLNAGNMENIIISNDMHVVLLSAPVYERSFSMSADAAELLNVRLSKNTLQVSQGPKKASTVYLCVTNLKSLKVESNSRVETIGILNAPRVEVFVDGRSRAHLRTNGIINAHGLDEAEVRVKYKTPPPVAKR